MTNMTSSDQKPTRSVSLVSTYASEGGAARATLRLMRSLRRIGVSTQLLCQFAGPSEPGVVGPQSKVTKIQAHVGRLYEDWVAGGNSSSGLFSPATRSWGEVAKTLVQRTDLVHLHWVQKGLLSIEAIGRIHRPFFWTFHDMWPLTSGHHYGGPDLLKRPGSGRLRSVWDRKVMAWAELPVSVVSPSRWLADLARESVFFRGRPVHVIPNAIDTEVFRPVDPQWARFLLGLPQGKKVVLFGAMDATSDPRKGYDLLVRALDGWSAREEVHLLIVGASEAPGLESLGYTWTCLGQLFDDLSLVIAYNAADVVVVPSRQENLSNMIVESMACGVPVVGFHIGGNPDVIVPDGTGELAAPEDPRSLQQALGRVLFAGTSRDHWSSSTRRFATQHFSPDVVARQHLNLYQSIKEA